MKKCSHCKGLFEPESLIVYSRFRGKQYYNCLNCNSARSRKYRLTKRGARNTLKAVYKSIKKYPEKQKARFIVYRAVRNGVIIRPSKCACGSARMVEAHHEDYSKPLQVNWLCRTCHSKLHCMIKLSMV